MAAAAAAAQHASHADVLVRSRYRLMRHLSETLYGAVYLCEDTKYRSVSPRSDANAVSAQTPSQLSSDVDAYDERRYVALKQVEIAHAMKILNRPLPHHQVLDDPRQEQAVANMLRRTGGHPNVVQYLESFVDGSTLFFVMEYCADSDLYEYLRSRGKTTLSPVDSMSVLAQVGAGLAFLHAHGIAHRDISLENVLLHNGACKLSDFGLSARATEWRTERVGKAYYMAPEVVHVCAPYDARAADMWSLGILLFILLTGSPLVPIASADDHAFAALKRVGVAAVLEAWGMALSPAITELLEGMLAIAPSERLTIDQVLRHRAFDEWEASIATADGDADVRGDADLDTERHARTRSI